MTGDALAARDILVHSTTKITEQHYLARTRGKQERHVEVGATVKITSTGDQVKVSTDFKSYFWIVCAFVVLPCLVLYIVISSHITSVFPQSPWAYAMQYDTESQYVVIDPKPHDCEFFKAPIGNKYCHFNKTVKTSKGDESVNHRTLVYVSWDKVPE